MLHEPTTLASVARLLGETLETDYGVDPGPLFGELGIDPADFHRPGSRVPFVRMQALWERSVQLTGDRWLGFRVGARARPGDFYVLGHAWLASGTLLDAYQRLCRYRRVLTSTDRQLVLQQLNRHYRLTERLADLPTALPAPARDAGYVALAAMSDLVTGKPVRPVRIQLTVPADRRDRRYADLFQCEVEYGAPADAWTFRAADLEAPLTGSIPDVSDATDQIAERYLVSLDGGSVSAEVRELLVRMLPAGRVEQDAIAQSMSRSASTLQRQLSAEGTSYREILDSTRCSLAEQYLRGGEYTKAQIAFMLGFADQSNFSRAFKRWTGKSPGQYQQAA